MIRRRKLMSSKKPAIGGSLRRLRMQVNRKRKILFRNRLFTLINLQYDTAERMPEPVCWGRVPEPSHH
ncbi:hypothetical protein [Plesiomonas shigelloides]|uniref:Uncharacterized protein n=1 Tax=Plesiomonas shigelloides 302-73 TaxID=1315976 RepID=R8ATI9_PLESH|nr:hypothetical protein [Plesiomonas shigelloides]MDO4688975.1 hypothetical protein [Plesiomonas sp.]EON89669.1 hypothetical protein PLESHI_03877 [Plesiomonas shigelloides 302-73]KAB7673945.1 hypothetical protein GBN16_14025 [Plesiomonas shigelloides]MDT1012419.1 hypothetical protein [Plesiomonas shigelloides]HAD41543.1 hypothetical protein [Plesiomonas shigelloides]